MAIRISSRVGAEFCASSAVADTIIPVMQNPHWIAPASRNACCTTEGMPLRANPSTVVTVHSATLTARHRHERIHHVVDQHIAGAASAGIAALLGAGERELVRSTSSSVRWLGIATACGSPLT